MVGRRHRHTFVLPLEGTAEEWETTATIANGAREIPREHVAQRNHVCQRHEHASLVPTFDHDRHNIRDATIAMDFGISETERRFQLVCHAISPRLLGPGPEGQDSHSRGALQTHPIPARAQARILAA